MANAVFCTVQSTTQAAAIVDVDLVGQPQRVVVERHVPRLAAEEVARARDARSARLGLRVARLHARRPPFPRRSLPGSARGSSSAPR